VRIDLERVLLEQGDILCVNLGPIINNVFVSFFCKKSYKNDAYDLMT
jgi:hypothetical protein